MSQAARSYPPKPARSGAHPEGVKPALPNLVPVSGSLAPARMETASIAALVAEARLGLTGAGPQQILEWALKRFPRDRIALCTSLQAGGMALLDLAWRIDPEVQVFTIDSGRLPAETLDLMEQVRQRYGIKLQVLYPDALEVSELVTEHGMNLFRRAPGLRLACCDVRKVRPLERRLRTLDAWITGIRREDNVNREAAVEVDIDVVHGGIVKISPLARWSEQQVWDYVEAHELPRNALYEKGYTSIGCEPCTRATLPGEHLRAGRWWWENGDKECGIHFEIQVNAEGKTVAVVHREAGNGNGHDGRKPASR